MTEERFYQIVVTIISGLCGLLFWFASRYVQDQARIIKADVDALRDDMRRRFEDAGERSSKLATRLQTLLDRNGITREEFSDLMERLTRVEERCKVTELWRGRKP